jgi:hypothetical protein
MITQSGEDLHRVSRSVCIGLADRLTIHTPNPIGHTQLPDADQAFVVAAGAGAGEGLGAAAGFALSPDPELEPDSDALELVSAEVESEAAAAESPPLAAGLADE